MSSGVLLKGAALVVFLGLMGGAAYGVQAFLGGDVEAALALHPTAPRNSLNATAGATVTFPVVLENRGEVARTAVLRAVGQGIDETSPVAIVPARGNATAFLTFQVPAGASPGERAVNVRVEDESGTLVRESVGLLRIRVLGPAVGFQDGDSALVRYTGRLAASGKVFDTNDPVVGRLNVPSTDTYSPSTQPLPIESRPEPSVIAGFFEGLLGMQPGESRTVTFPPEKGYGGATTTTPLDRVDELDREFPLPLRNDSVARNVFDQYVDESGQGAGSDYEAGDVFRFEQGANRWPYRIVSIDESEVEYTLAVQPGENYTLYPFWEGASAVITVNETHALFRTTPTQAVGEALTLRSYWPEMSTLTSVNATSIVVTHSPPVGFKFQLPATQFERAREATVSELTDAEVIIAVASPNPLAGQALTFDIELLEIQR